MAIITTLLASHGFEKANLKSRPENEVWELNVKDDKKDTLIRISVKGWFGVQNVEVFIRPIMGKYIEKNFINDNLIRSIFQADEWLSQITKSAEHPAYTAKMIFNTLTREMNWSMTES